MKIVYGVALPEQVRRLLDLAKCVGVDVEAIGVTGEHDLEEALSVPVAGPSALVIDIESLAQALPASAARVRDALRRGGTSVLLLVTSPSQTASRYLSAVTGGIGQSVGLLAAAEAQSVLFSGALAGELRDRVFERAPKRALYLAAGDDLFEPIMSIGGRHLFGRIVEPDSPGEVFVWSTECVFDMLRPLNEEREFELAMDEYVPAIIFLRRALGDRCWHSPSAAAALVIDDPLIRRRYGFIRFERLLESARRTGYHVSLAFIPWNHGRTRARDAAFFRSYEDVFSVCVHGNDHTKGEFYSNDRERLGSSATEALFRMDAHRERTGLTYQRVMVYPQERYSVQAVRALAETGEYVGVANSRFIPPDPAAQGTLSGADLLLPAQDFWFGMPILKRHYASEGLSKFAFALFMGRPAVLAEHHEYFRTGTDRIEAFVRELRLMSPNLQWGSLEQVLRRLCRRRQISGRDWCLRIFADTFELLHDNDEEARYELHRRVSDDAVIDAVTVDGVPTPFVVQDSTLRFHVETSVRGMRTVRIHRRLSERRAPRGQPFSYRLKVGLRRVLSEFRDNVLSRSAVASEVASACARVLRQTRN